MNSIVEWAGDGKPPHVGFLVVAYTCEVDAHIGFTNAVIVFEIVNLREVNI